MSNAVYQVITDRILALLDSGIVPWQKPWRADTDLPRSIRGRAYRGINVWLLLFRGFSDPRWLTYKQATELGGKVRKGEKGTPVVLWKPVQVDDPEAEGGKRTVPFIRYYTVFNVEQCEGIDVAALPVSADPDPIAECEAIVEGYTDRPTVTFDGMGRAFYLPADDTIHLPKRNTFRSPEAVYATEFHEFGHSTGAEKRLNRPGVAEFDHFGSDRYAKEELVAEMTSAFLCGQAGIDPVTVENAAAYVASWRSKIAEDPKLVVQAAAAAQKAADYILGVSKAAEQKEAA